MGMLEELRVAQERDPRRIRAELHNVEGIPYRMAFNKDSEDLANRTRPARFHIAMDIDGRGENFAVGQSLQ
jgi:hypothetical protein